jgi:ABC-2 type transport system permease protein
MSSRLPLLWLALHRRRRMLIALMLGMVVFESLIIVIARASPPQQLFANEIQTAPGLFHALSGSGGDVPLTTYPGLLGFGLIHPFWIALQLVVVASLAAATVAGDVEAGTIELLMVRPISRARLLTERIAALVIALIALNAAATAALAVGVALTPQIHRAVPVRGIVAAGVLGLALGLCIAGPAIAISAAGHRRSQVLGATVAIGAVGFAVNFVAEAWSGASILRFASPFHYYAPADVLAGKPVPWTSVGVLIAVAITGTSFAAWLLSRRDLAY